MMNTEREARKGKAEATEVKNTSVLNVTCDIVYDNDCNSRFLAPAECKGFIQSASQGS